MNWPAPDGQTTLNQLLKSLPPEVFDALKDELL